MRGLLGIRITKWYFKLTYAFGAWLIGFPIVALGSVGVPPVLVSWLSTALTLAAVIYGARVFRGAGETIAPPRPWWQMTARRPLSLVVGILALVSLIAWTPGVIGTVLGTRPAVLSLHDDLGSFITLLVVAILYVNSAARLPRPAPREPEVRIKPARRLD